jgi:hypothetical protein
VALEAAVAELQAARPRDVEDAALRRMLPVATYSLLFTAAELLQRGRLDPELGAALAAATLASAPEVGCWLRAQRGTRDGVRIAREGRRWRCTWCT